ncbi:hypothetical protein, partial [Salmonella enterica]|uniref:hypothetical protein n=1 Tax=Salmonella enterica TaxID=28901 RepID=UPI0032B40A34
RKKKAHLIEKIQKDSLVFWKYRLISQEEELIVQSFKFNSEEVKVLNQKFQLLLENQSGSETILAA